MTIPLGMWDLAKEFVGMLSQVCYQLIDWHFSESKELPTNKFNVALCTLDNFLRDQGKVWITVHTFDSLIGLVGYCVLFAVDIVVSGWRAYFGRLSAHAMIVLIGGHLVSLEQERFNE